MQNEEVKAGTKMSSPEWKLGIKEITGEWQLITKEIFLNICKEVYGSEMPMKHSKCIDFNWRKNN